MTKNIVTSSSVFFSIIIFAVITQSHQKHDTIVGMWKTCKYDLITKIIKQKNWIKIFYFTLECSNFTIGEYAQRLQNYTRPYLELKFKRNEVELYQKQSVKFNLSLSGKTHAKEKKQKYLYLPRRLIKVNFRWYNEHNEIHIYFDYKLHYLHSVGTYSYW